MSTPNGSPRPPRPVALKPIFDNFPPALVAIDRWIMWRYTWIEKNQKWDKPPLTVQGWAGSSTNPAKWATFADARAAYERGGFDGVGFVVLNDPDRQPVWGFDVDDKAGTERWIQAGGELTDEATTLLQSLDSYTERSPSGRGLRVFGFGPLPFLDEIAVPEGKPQPDGTNKNGFEVYRAGKYLSITGQRFDEFPGDLMERAEQIDASTRGLFPPTVLRPTAPRPAPESLPDDAELLRRAFGSKSGAKIQALYNGDMSAYQNDHSRADLGLCGHFAFWSGGDPARVHRWFRESGLMRDKWDELHGAETYGDMTVHKAINGKAEFYDPNKKTEPRKGKRGPKTASAPPDEADGEPDDNDLVLEVDDGEGDTKRGPSVATRLVEIARERFTLWHTPERKAYATVPTAGGHNETWEVESTGFRDQLARVYFAESGKAIAPAAMQAALYMVGTFARLDGEERTVYTRKADLSLTEGAIYLDLSNEKWQAVKITVSGWAVVDNPPVAFRRTGGMRPLPVPETGGRLADLRQFVNMPVEGDGGDILIFAWLLAALGPHTSYPILHLMGEQGTAKTWAGRFLRALVDPSHPDLRREPKEDRDLAIAGTNAFVVAFDNVSSFPLWLSDTLCTIATGGGFGTRKLHSDNDEALFSFKCPVLMTGIGEASTKGDFLQRSLLVSLPVVSEEGRKAEADVVPAFDAAKPKLLGALLDAVSCGLRNLATTRLAESPRMADFARWIVACESACPWPAGEFLEAYKDNQATGGEATLDADKIAPLIVRLVGDQYDRSGKWTGTAADLMDALGNLIGDKDKSALPKNARALMVGVKRIAPALRTEKGIDFTGPVKSNGKKVYTFASGSQTGSQKSKAGSQTGSQNDSGAASQNDFHEGGAAAGSQRPQRPQNSPYSTSVDKTRKKGEEGETGGQNAQKEEEEYNAGNFAAFAALRPGWPEPMRDASTLTRLLRFVQNEYHGTGLDIRAAFGVVVRVENERITGVWNGPLGGKLAFGVDHFLRADEPLPVAVAAGATPTATDTETTVGAANDDAAADAPDDGPSLYDEYDTDPFADEGEEL